MLKNFRVENFSPSLDTLRGGEGAPPRGHTQMLPLGRLVWKWQLGRVAPTHVNYLVVSTLEYHRQEGLSSLALGRL